MVNDPKDPRTFNGDDIAREMNKRPDSLDHLMRNWYAAMPVKLAS